jgi:transcription elongation GreA/GreB family factor
MSKARLLQQIIDKLEADLALLSGAARAAHAAATDTECQPDNKYDTTALEASYVAQGQANRAAQIRTALATYRSMNLRSFNNETPIRLGALVTLENDAGEMTRVFLGPEAGGLKLATEAGEVVVVTPAAPLGRELLGKTVGDDLETAGGKTYSVVAVE